MEISIIDRSERVDNTTREFAERRLLFALSKFGSTISRVSLVITDVNGSKDTIDKRCTVKITMPRKSDIFISDEDSVLAACIARAAERAGRTVARRLSSAVDAKRRHRGFNVGP